MGALLGGVLTDFLSWRLAFLINVPIAVGITIAAPAVIAKSRHAQRPRLDAPGAVTVTAGLLALVHGVSVARQDGWGSGTALGVLAVSAVLLGTFFAIERRSEAPLVPVAVLARRAVKWGNLGGDPDIRYTERVPGGGLTRGVRAGRAGGGAALRLTSLISGGD